MISSEEIFSPGAENFGNLIFSKEQEISTQRKLSTFTGIKYFDLNKKGSFVGYRLIKKLGYKNWKFFSYKRKYWS